MLDSLEANVGTPTFFSVGFTQCHYPIYLPAETMETVPEDPAYPPIPEDDFDDIPNVGKGFGKAFKPNADLARSGDGELGKQYIRHFYGCIRFVDELVGRLVEFIDNSPDDYILVFTSDHGFHLLDKERMSKFTLWSAVTQVPLIMYGHDFKGGKVVNTPVSLVDLYKTFVDIIGEEPEYPLQGKNLADIANGGQRDPVVVYHKWGKAVITEEWHLITYQRYDYENFVYKEQQNVFELYAKDDPW